MKTVNALINTINSELWSALIGAIVGLLVSVIFDDSLRELKRNMKRRYKRLFTEKNEFKSHLFTIGKTSTNFFVVDGDGLTEIKPENIECRVSNDPIQLPEELEQLKKEIADNEALKELNGMEHKWNGPLYSLVKYRNSRTEHNEDMTVLFNFHKTDYFTFQALNMQLSRQLMSGKTIAEEYIPYNRLETLQPILANGFGIGLVIITSDQDIIFTQRTEYSGTRGSQMDISVVEGVHPHLDNNPPDLFNTAIRGAKEELGITITRDMIKFLGYGIDLDYYQWNMIGFAEVTESAKEIQKIRSRGSSGKWENSLLINRNFKPQEVAKIIVNEDMWSTAKVAIYWTAVNQLGKNDVERALNKELKKHN
ncbi:hypothetical protein [Paenisporosarcina sp. NPDC076907]|uniref:hypothetical protein n=1 Tax=Paenisporosarcina sp. NPDC076907 TaxID=3390604 RepID=UPI003D011C60